jgi:hypothetical protein
VSTAPGQRIRELYHDTGPQINNLSAPERAQVGQLLSFSTPEPVSIWRPLHSVAWAFGDGTSAYGISVNHVYARPGVYRLTMAASDEQLSWPEPFLDNVNTPVTRSITIVPPGASRAPVISKARQSHRRWREGRNLAQISHHSQPPVGTEFSFSLNESAAVSLTFTTRVPGQRVGRRCLPATHRRREGKACKRTASAGVLSFSGHRGTNKIAFDGRLSKTHKLRPRDYTLAISATNAAGQRSTAQPLRFAIVK